MELEQLEGCNFEDLFMSNIDDSPSTFSCAQSQESGSQICSFSPKESSMTDPNDPFALLNIASLEAFSDPSTPIKTRHRLQPYQTEALLTHFHNDSNPTAVARNSLADKLNMNEREVQIWFQNRRAKAKKEKPCNGEKTLKISEKRAKRKTSFKKRVAEEANLMKGDEGQRLLEDTNELVTSLNATSMNMLVSIDSPLLQPHTLPNTPFLSHNFNHYPFPTPSGSITPQFSYNQIPYPIQPQPSFSNSMEFMSPTICGYDSPYPFVYGPGEEYPFYYFSNGQTNGLSNYYSP